MTKPEVVTRPIRSPIVNPDYAFEAYYLADELLEDRDREYGDSAEEAEATLREKHPRTEEDDANPCGD